MRGFRGGGLFGLGASFAALSTVLLQGTQNFQTLGVTLRGERPSRRAARRARYSSGGVTYAPNGAREVARRRRQIITGQLNYENGLCRESMKSFALTPDEEIWIRDIWLNPKGKLLAVDRAGYSVHANA